MRKAGCAAQAMIWSMRPSSRITWAIPIAQATPHSIGTKRVRVMFTDEDDKPPKVLSLQGQSITLLIHMINILKTTLSTANESCRIVILLYFVCGFTNRAMTNSSIEGKWWLLSSVEVANHQKPFHISDLIKLESGKFQQENVGYRSGTLTRNETSFQLIKSDEIELDQGLRIKFKLLNDNTLEVYFEKDTVIYYDTKSYHYKGVVGEDLVQEQLLKGYWVEEQNKNKKLYFYDELSYQQFEKEGPQWMVMLLVESELTADGFLFLKAFQRNWAIKALNGIVFLRFSHPRRVNTRGEFEISSSDNNFRNAQQNKIFIVERFEDKRLELVSVNTGNEVSRFLLLGID